MTLDEYLNKHSIKPLQFAKTAGLRGKATVYRYISGEITPRKENMKRIQLATNGEVTANDFHAD